MLSTFGLLLVLGGYSRGAKQGEKAGEAAKRRVFIDLGANCGNSLLRFQRKHPEVSFDDIYLWEVNPRIVRVWLEPRAALDRRIHVISQPAWYTTTNVTFYQDLRSLELSDAAWMEKYPCQDAGFPPQSDTWRNGSSFTKQTIDFEQWFKELALSPHDEAWVKIDIEGAEIPIIRNFMESEHFCAVRWWAIEWHLHRAVHMLHDERDARGMARRIIQQFKRLAANCKAVVESWY